MENKKSNEELIKDAIEIEELLERALHPRPVAKRVVCNIIGCTAEGKPYEVFETYKQYKEAQDRCYRNHIKGVDERNKRDGFFFLCFTLLLVVCIIIEKINKII